MLRGLILTHGAGGNSKAPLLIAVENAFAAAGYRVQRFDLAFRQRRPFGPPSPANAAQDRESIRESVVAMRKLVDGPVIVGGHSYGGRQASMLAAEDHGLADGLLLLSYPLHPPNKPEQLRTAHFHALRTPAIFVHGTKDPFGTIEELRTAITMIPAKTELIVIEGSGHDLARGRFDMGQVTGRFDSGGT
jgi:predicted alpha/beta-hydrolase family hydrolase